MDFNESVTKENLARAFAGICQDGARYQFIAKLATNEGFNCICECLKEVAKNKMAHASVLYQLMLKNINNQKEHVNIEAGYPFETQLLKTSLEDSAEIEDNEGRNIFPHFARIAHDEGFKEIEKVFSLISNVNLKNSAKLKMLAEKFDKRLLYKSDKPKLWVCTNCGHSEEKREAWDFCPLCNYPQGYVNIQAETE